MQKKSAWLWGIDFVLLVMIILWAMKVGFPPDVRRVWLGIFAGFYFFSPQAKRQLVLSQILRRLLCSMIQRPRVLKRALWIYLSFLVFLGILSALAFQYTLYDVGIFHQLLWNLSHGNGYFSSISDAGYFFRDHLVWSLAGLVPFYWLTFGNPWLMGILPGILVGGLLAVIFGSFYYLASHVSGFSTRRRAWVSSVLVLGAWGLQAFWGNLAWGFHENIWGAALLSWGLVLALLHFQSGRRSRGAFLCILALWIAAAGAKETFLLVVALSSLGFILMEVGQRHGIHGIHDKKALKFKEDQSQSWVSSWILALLSLGCLGVFFWYIQSDRDPNKNYFVRYFGYLGSDLPSMVRSLATDPLRVFKTIPVKDQLGYLMDFIFPWGLLPIIAVYGAIRERRAVTRSTWIALGILPSVTAAFLSSYRGMKDPNMHYFFEIVPTLGVLTVLAFFQLPPLKMKRWGMIWLFLTWGVLGSEPWRDIRSNLRLFWARLPLLSELNRIPKDLAVMAEDPAGPWVSSRQWASTWYNLHAMSHRCPDVYIFNAEAPPHPSYLTKIEDIRRLRLECGDTQGGLPRLVVSGSGTWVFTTSSVW